MPEYVWNGDIGFPQTDEHPVVNVSWNDATAFCEWLSTRTGGTYLLPTEAQWEYSCRAGTTTPWHSGDDQRGLSDWCWFSAKESHPVGQLQKNPYGLHDMHAGVGEWCADWYSPEYYSMSPESDPVGPISGLYRVQRSGNYIDRSFGCRSAHRRRTRPTKPSKYLGFRLAANVESDLIPVAEGDRSDNEHARAAYDWSEDRPAPVIAPVSAEEAKRHQEAWAKYLGVPVEQKIDLGNDVNLTMTLIPPGEFLMGSSKEEWSRALDQAKIAKDSRLAYFISAEGPQHFVRITKPFWLGSHEVTIAQFRQFVEAMKYETDAERLGGGFVEDKRVPELVWNGDVGFPQTGDHPVVNVSWNDATAFCEWLSRKHRDTTFSLPTEAQWEYSCRAGTTSVLYSGDDEDVLRDHAWWLGNSEGRSHPVGQLQPNSYRLYDMHGNVHEWCADLFASDYYAVSQVNDPLGPASGGDPAALRVQRGGSNIRGPLSLRSAHRRGAAPTVSSAVLGFRVSATLDAFKPPASEVPTDEPKAYSWPQDQPAPAIAPFTAEEAKQHQEAWAKHLGVPVEMGNSIGMKFRVIPPGEFLMGSSEEEIAKLLEEAKEQGLNETQIADLENSRGQHRVVLTNPRAIGSREVTRGQFRQFVDTTGYSTDAERDGKGGMGFKGQEGWLQAPEFLWNTDLGFDQKQTEDHPVVNVSWNDAAAFCNWLSEKEGAMYRLPTEAEWEFACRAGTMTRFHFGADSAMLSEYAWHNNLGGKHTKPVATKKPNAFGLFDMHGNVSEVCSDLYGPYSKATALNPTGAESGTFRSLRSFPWSFKSTLMHSAVRDGNTASFRAYTVGFRIVHTFKKYEPKKPEAEGPAIAPKPRDSFGHEDPETTESEDTDEK